HAHLLLSATDETDTSFLLSILPLFPFKSTTSSLYTISNKNIVAEATEYFEFVNDDSRALGVVLRDPVISVKRVGRKAMERARAGRGRVRAGSTL
ncbi:hypothetical protein HK097_001267, partial [Rhizophlyctis rosea]